MRLYMAVTNDEYEEPVGVADSVRELAGMVGRKPSNIYRVLRMGENADFKGKYNFKVVDVDGSDEA